MAEPQFADELFFDDDISVTELNSDGSMVAIGIPSLLGIYRVARELGGASLEHIASYMLPKNRVIKSAFFSADSSSITIITDDGVRRSLSITSTKRGFMKELDIRSFAKVA